MKTLILLLLSFSIFSFHKAYANKEVGNGGDICEDRVKTIREDLDAWIIQGGSADLKLPASISLSSYNSEMLKGISQAQVSCTAGAILVGNVEKTCKNYVDPKGIPRIVCNEKLFMETSESDQYVLVHHEYAGLAGFEVNDGENSQYNISNQISEYLVEAVIKKLAIKSGANGASNTLNDSSLFDEIPPGTKIILGKGLDLPPYETRISFNDYDLCSEGRCITNCDLTFKSSTSERVLDGPVIMTVIARSVDAYSNFFKLRTRSESFELRCLNKNYGDGNGVTTIRDFKMTLRQFNGQAIFPSPIHEK